MTTTVTFVQRLPSVTARAGSAGTGGAPGWQYNQAGQTYNQAGILYNGDPRGNHGVIFVAPNPAVTVRG
jgi:hypothetical protein